MKIVDPPDGLVAVFLVRRIGEAYRVSLGHPEAIEVAVMLAAARQLLDEVQAAIELQDATANGTRQ